VDSKLGVMLSAKGQTAVVNVDGLIQPKSNREDDLRDADTPSYYD